MNIFETKSKYFKNNNTAFATFFSSGVGTLIIILVGIVLTYNIIVHIVIYKSNEKLNSNVAHKLQVNGFTYSGKIGNSGYVYPTDNRYDDFVYFFKWLYNPILSSDTIKDAYVVARTLSLGYGPMDIEDLIIRWSDQKNAIGKINFGGYEMQYSNSYTVTSWNMYRSSKFYPEDTTCYLISKIFEDTPEGRVAVTKGYR